MIEFPPVEMPSDLAGVANGHLGPCNLTTVFFPAVGHLSLHPLAARAWHAMTAICKAETSADLTTTGTYRSYDAQLQLFLQRYTDSFLPLRNVVTNQRTWQGKTWWLRRGMAPAAVPGTSNHGWAIAVDTAVAVKVYNSVTQKWTQKVVAITADPKVWSWLQANAMSFGFGWEGARPGQPGWEPWHIRYWAGDRIPQRVLDVEAWFAGVKP